MNSVNGTLVTLISTSLCFASLAESGTLPSTTATGSNPFEVQQNRPNVRLERPQEASTDSLPGQVIPTTEADDSLCSELNQLAIAEGHEPVHSCSEPPTTFYPGTGTGTAAVPEMLEDVLLIPGFGASSKHECTLNWQRQKDELQKQNRVVKIVGYYSNNSGCDVSISNFANMPIDNSTPIDEISGYLHDWIFEEYSIYGQSVDIAAHSLGGIIVRKMLDDEGGDILVSDVVTLGSPHDGVKALYVAAGCWKYKQCVEQGAGSPLINNLAENPQSAIPTQWTLIAAAGDQVVGRDTGIAMSNGNSGGPPVIPYQYADNHKHGCSIPSFSLGHEDLIGENAAKAVNVCNWLGGSTGTVINPMTRMINALN